VCDTIGAEQRHDATTQGWAAIIAGGSGLAVLTVGTILTATAPGPRVVSSKSAFSSPPGGSTGVGAVTRAGARAWQVVPMLSAHQGGLGLKGVW
jgi:hypothetical protein